MSTIQTIVHPTDFSAEGNHAFQVACSLAKDYNARLILLHVMRPSVAPVMEGTMSDTLAHSESQEDVRARFPWPPSTDASLRLEYRVAEGDASDEIIHLAHAVQCDLIVVGTHGRTGWNRLLTGSVAEEVLRRATCPVMAVKNLRDVPSAATAPAKTLARPYEIVNVRPLGNALHASHSEKLLAAHGIAVARLVLPAGKEVFEYRTKGTLIVHCLEGCAAVTAFGKTQKLEAGQLLYLPKEEPHTIKGVEDCSLLLTTALPPS